METHDIWVSACDMFEKFGPEAPLKVRSLTEQAAIMGDIKAAKSWARVAEIIDALERDQAR